MRLALVSVVLVGLLVPRVAEAQPSRASLERRLRASPNDARLLCEVGWMRFLAGAGGGAELLDRGIAALGEPSTRAERNRLAACLYSRGRAHEVPGDPDTPHTTGLYDGGGERALALYERSLALRPNAVVERRAEAVRAILAAAWRTRPIDEAYERALREALGVDEHRLIVHRRAVSPDGVNEAALATRLDEGQLVLVLHVGGRGGRGEGRWREARVAPTFLPNGTVEYDLFVAPSPPGQQPTFFIGVQWSHRTCCDEEGYPDWSHGRDAHLVWQVGEAWRVASLGGELGGWADVTFQADGRVVVERPQGDLSPRTRALVGTRSREDWLAP